MGTIRTRGLWFVIGALLLLSPLGLLAEGAAWGEWGAEELGEMLGFVPEGLEELGSLWQAPAPDYVIAGLDPTLGYILSGALGVGAVVLASWLLGRWLSRDGAGG
jgi:cobalt/nickel transport protein